MASICCVPKCRRRRRDGNDYMFPFPEDPILRKKWIRNIIHSEPSWELGFSDKVCEVSSTKFEQYKIKIRKSMK